ncbi:MAG: hypothetical protein CL910_10455 [Deltaproteobacteria bacterium]|nr:hypothetical protein [Deltaproteobacteria bacterium]
MTNLPERPLDRTERRIVGVLIEKELTTPNQYPLSLNGLITGCNQKNNRDPVVSFEQFEVEGALRALFVRKWVASVSDGGRVTKWRHRVSELMQLDRPTIAVLAELLLRGAQQPGELRTRASRMAPALATADDAKQVLDAMMSGPEPLVVCRGRDKGARADRYDHTLWTETEIALGDGVAAPRMAVAAPEPVAAPTPSVSAPPAPTPTSPKLASQHPSHGPVRPAASGDLAQQVQRLEHRVHELERRLGMHLPESD